MPREVRLYQLEELTNKYPEIFIKTEKNTELHIELFKDLSTKISFPFGNKFDVINGSIIIYPKTK